MPIPFLSRRRAGAFLACLAAAAALPAAAAEAYPTKLIKIVAPFPPGNSSDVAARFLSEHLAKKLGVTVIVENRVGAAGQVGSSAVARAEPDGHTLLMTSTSFAISPALYKTLPYDPNSDFVPVVHVAVAPMVLVVRPDFPASNVAEFVREIKRNPDKNSYAHAGAGTIQHLTAESFLARVQQPVVAVPYKGSAQALTDVIGGQVQFMFDAVLSARTQIESGRLKALGVSSPVRSTLLPKVPTMQESKAPGLDDYVIEGWVGLLAPKNTPAHIVALLNKELSEILHAPQMRERLLASGILVAPRSTPEQFGKFLRADIARWQSIATAAKLEKE